MDRKTVNRRMYFLLFGACVITSAAVLPYAVSLAGGALNQVPFSMPVFVILTVIQSSVIFAVVVLLGLMLSRSTALGLPVVEALLSGQASPVALKRLFTTAVIWGLITGLSIAFLDWFFSRAGASINLWSAGMPPIWTGLLASFYGGIAEEVIMRLFLMNLLVWVIGKVSRRRNPPRETPWVIWLSIIVAALVFGAGHLPITAAVTGLTPLVVIRAFVLNGVGGVVFGWLFWKHGLESAVVAHFSTDIVLHTMLPLVVGLI